MGRGVQGEAGELWGGDALSGCGLGIRRGLRRGGEVEELCDACHFGKAEVVLAAGKALAGSNTADMICKLKPGRKGRALLCHTVAMHSDKQSTAVSRVWADVNILKENLKSFINELPPLSLGTCTSMNAMVYPSSPSCWQITGYPHHIVLLPWGSMPAILPAGMQ